MKLEIYDTTDVTISHIRRLSFIGWLIFLFIAGTVYRLYWVQFVDSEYWMALARKEHVKRIPVVKKRGTIYDRNRNKLATSVPARSIYVNPNEITDAELVADKLAEILSLDRARVLADISRPVAFVWIARGIDDEVCRQITELKLKGVYEKKEFKRVYPQKNLASHILGFVGLDEDGVLDNKGLEGIELTFDRELAGKTGWVTVETGIRGSAVEKQTLAELKLDGGRSLVLSLDEVIQHIIEKEADALCAEYSPESVVIIVADPATGDILGLVNRPDFDPNRPSCSTPSARRNLAVTDIYEPGSTFKIMTFLAALDNGVISETDTFNCNGSIDLYRGEEIIKCTGVHGLQTIYDVFANSCNVGTIEIARRIGKNNLYRAIRSYGFGFKTGSGISGEVAGLIRKPQDWSVRSIGSVAIGQEVGVTALQLVAATCAVLNRGIMMKPRFVHSIEEADGSVLKRFPPEEIGKITSEENAAHLIRFMRNCVLYGTGKLARIEGYDILGKTGTAQIIGKSGKYEPGVFASSFIGFINEPSFKVAIYVLVRHPKGKDSKLLHGGRVCGPAFKRIAEEMLMYFKVLPERRLVEKVYQLPERVEQIRAPNLIGRNFEELKELARDLRLNLQYMGRGSIAIKQSPSALKLMARSDPIVVYFGTPEDLNLTRSREKGLFMPMLIGRSMREALEILSRYDQLIEFYGSGLVVRQEPGAGERLDADEVIRIYFAPPSTREKQPAMSNDTAI